MKTYFNRLCICVVCVLLFCSCGGKKYEVNNSNPIDIKGIDTKTINLNVYIENSGSMDGYMHPSSEFKNDLYSYLGALASEVKSTKLNYINSQIIPINESIEQFFQNLTPANFKVMGLNRSHSEIVQMFSDILKQMDKNTVSIFASDCILDVMSGAANDYFENRRTTLRDVIKKHMNKNPDFAVEIICTSSKFDGMLYPPNSSPVPCKAQRPYYVWIFGSKYLLGALNEKIAPKTAFRSGKIKYVSSFAQCGQMPFTLNLNGNENNNILIRGKNHEFDILADMSSALLPDDVLSDLKSYSYKESKVTIKSVDRITEPSSKYTHTIHVVFENTSKAIKQVVSLNMNKQPSWAEEMNDDKTGTAVGKTFGIKYLVYAISDAYAKATPAQLKFEIKNK